MFEAKNYRLRSTTKADEMSKIRLPMSAFTIGYLRECFILDEDAGVLIWKERPAHHFRDEADAMRVNSRRAGRVAGIPDSNRGRVKVCVSNRGLFAHRIIYALANGIDLQDVPLIIDHINGDESESRPSNLRGATPAQSVHNRGMPKSNTTGVKGVKRSATEGKFCASIKAFGKQVHLGTFSTKEEAAAAYRGAAKILHGDYMRQ